MTTLDQEPLFGAEPAEIEAADVEEAAIAHDVPQALYRFWGYDETLLYIGITFRPNLRWKNHAKEKEWWHEVAAITVHMYPSRPAVESAEREAIKRERPKYNIALNPGPMPSSVVDLPGVQGLNYETAKATAAFFRTRAEADPADRPCPLDKDQLAWVATMIELAADLSGNLEARRPRPAHNLPNEPARIALTGREIWISTDIHDFMAFRMRRLQCGVGTGPNAEWLDVDTERCRGRDVIVVAQRFEDGWSKAGAIATKLCGVGSTVRVVRPAAGIDAQGHFYSRLRPCDFIPVPQPVVWTDEDFNLIAHEVAADIHKQGALLCEEMK